MLNPQLAEHLQRLNDEDDAYAERARGRKGGGESADDQKTSKAKPVFVNGFVLLIRSLTLWTKAYDVVSDQKIFFLLLLFRFLVAQSTVGFFIDSLLVICCHLRFSQQKSMQRTDSSFQNAALTTSRFRISDSLGSIGAPPLLSSAIQSFRVNKSAEELSSIEEFVQAQKDFLVAFDKGLSVLRKSTAFQLRIGPAARGVDRVESATLRRHTQGGALNKGPLLSSSTLRRLLAESICRQASAISFQKKAASTFNDKEFVSLISLQEKRAKFLELVSESSSYLLASSLHTRDLRAVTLATQETTCHLSSCCHVYRNDAGCTFETKTTHGRLLLSMAKQVDALQVALFTYIDCRSDFRDDRARINWDETAQIVNDIIGAMDKVEKEIRVLTHRGEESDSACHSTLLNRQVIPSQQCLRTADFFAAGLESVSTSSHEHGGYPMKTVVFAGNGSIHPRLLTSKAPTITPILQTKVDNGSELCLIKELERYLSTFPKEEEIDSKINREGLGETQLAPTNSFDSKRPNAPAVSFAYKLDISELKRNIAALQPDGNDCKEKGLTRDRKSVV